MNTHIIFVLFSLLYISQLIISRQTKVVIGINICLVILLGILYLGFKKEDKQSITAEVVSKQTGEVVKSTNTAVNTPDVIKNTEPSSTIKSTPVHCIAHRNLFFGDTIFDLTSSIMNVDDTFFSVNLIPYIKNCFPSIENWSNPGDDYSFIIPEDGAYRFSMMCRYVDGSLRGGDGGIGIKVTRDGKIIIHPAHLSIFFKMTDGGRCSAVSAVDLIMKQGDSVQFVAITTSKVGSLYFANFEIEKIA
jgi:hypothetical protein